MPDPAASHQDAQGKRFFTGDPRGRKHHPHQMSYEQVARGMYGMLIVDEDKPLAVDREVLRALGYQIATIACECKASVRSRALGDPLRIESNALPEPDPAKAVEHFLVFEGGLLGKPAIGMVDGKPLKIPEIMRSRGLSWTMNYVAEHEHAMLHTPMFSFRQGEHVVLKMVNETEFEHPMHLHGHSFRVLRVNDLPTRFREWRDTVMVAPRGSVDVAFVADNPGEWMFHCHILEHAASGMMATVAVE